MPIDCVEEVSNDSKFFTHPSLVWANRLKIRSDEEPSLIIINLSVARTAQTELLPEGNCVLANHFSPKAQNVSSQVNKGEVSD